MLFLFLRAITLEMPYSVMYSMCRNENILRHLISENFLRERKGGGTPFLKLKIRSTPVKRRQGGGGVKNVTSRGGGGLKSGNFIFISERRGGLV